MSSKSCCSSRTVCCIDTCLNRLAEWPETCPEQLAYRSEDFGQDATSADTAQGGLDANATVQALLAQRDEAVPGLIAYMPRVCLLEKPAQ